MSVIRSGQARTRRSTRAEGAARTEARPRGQESKGKAKVDDEQARYDGGGGKSGKLEATRAKRTGGVALRAQAGHDESRAFTADGKRKWKVPPPGVEVIPNESGEGASIEKWQSPTTGKWVHNYTLEYMQTRSEQKFVENRRFAGILPELRAQVARDLGKDGTKAQLCALAVALIDKAYFRVGNEDSDDKGSYGVTTLLARHIKFCDDGKVEFRYVGKKQVENHRVVVDKGIAKLLKRVLAGKQPGARALVFKSDVIDAGDVNRYLEKFGATAKQFRTFHATRLMHEELQGKRGVPKAKRQAVVDAAFERVAKLLGHTPAVCEQSYVDKTVVAGYLQGKERAA